MQMKHTDFNYASGVANFEPTRNFKKSKHEFWKPYQIYVPHEEIGGRRFLQFGEKPAPSVQGAISWKGKSSTSDNEGNWKPDHGHRTVARDKKDR